LGKSQIFGLIPNSIPVAYSCGIQQVHLNHRHELKIVIDLGIGSGEELMNIFFDGSDIQQGPRGDQTQWYDLFREETSGAGSSTAKGIALCSTAKIKKQDG
jgi:hypothetical protein